MDLAHRSLRPARDADVPALAELWTEAFPGSRSKEERVRELREGMAYGTLDDCRLLDVDGRVAAGLRTYRMELHFRGRRYPTMGLAGVAVAPDFRRRGLGRRVCIEALREARAAGDVLSLLYPFRAAFYGTMGYALAGELQQYRFRLADLPLFPGWDRVARASDGDLPEVRGLYGQVASRSNGLLERGRGAWRLALAPGSDLYLHRNDGGQVTGYVVVRRGTWKSDRPSLRVRELLWSDDAAYLGLLGWLAAQRDQYTHAVHDALPSERFHRHLPHPRREGSGRPRGLWFESARILRGPMLRVLDLGGVLDAGAGGEVRVDDPDLPDNAGSWRGGRRAAEGDGGPEALTMEEASRLFVLGELPGQARPPAGWSPVSGIHDFRLLDEF